MNNRTSRLSPSGFALLAALAAVIGAVAVLAIPGRTWASSSSAAPASTSQVLRAVAAASKLTSVPDNVMPSIRDAADDNGYPQAYSQGCVSPAEAVKMPACVYGDTTAKRTMILFGDSHAEMWLPAFDAMDKRLHWKLIFLAKSGCPPAYLQSWDPYRGRFPFVECNRWHAYATQRIKNTHAALVVMTDEYDTPQQAHRAPIEPPEWTAGLVRTLRRIEAPGTRVVILGDTPYLAQSAPECLAAHQSDIQACSTASKDAILTANNAAESKAAAITHAGYISVDPWFCSATCAPVIANTIVYSDAYHITGTYGIYLTGALQAALRLH